MAYEEYPKAMVHPNYQPALVERPSPGKPLLPGEQPQSAKAAVFPPVTVMNEDQEEYHKSLGYTSQKGDPSAHQPDVPAGYEPQEYPKMIGEVIVNSAEEEAALLPVPDPDDEPYNQVVEDERPALRAEYEKAFGKKPFGGWSAEVLREKLAKVPA